MPVWLKGAGIGGSLLVLIALVITFLKQLITFIGFITGAIKLLVILVFVVLIVAVGYLVIKSWNDTRRTKI